MDAFLLGRADGAVSHRAFARQYHDVQTRSLSTYSNLTFDWRPASRDIQVNDQTTKPEYAPAHPAAVNSIAIDKFQGRYLLSAAADASVAMWDLCSESSQVGTQQKVIRPESYAARAQSAHKYGITHVDFYPFDSLAFLTSSYDHTIKLWSSETLQASASFEMQSIVYSFAMSPVSQQLLVATASEHPAVRLVDLRSGASTHSLAGHAGAVLAVAWHPINEYMLASGSADGSLRIWDTRRSANNLAVLDANDATGTAYSRHGQGAVIRSPDAKAHTGAVNGLVWSDDGQTLVSTGHDERARVWNGTNFANTMVNFGPAIKNAHKSTMTPLLSPTGTTSPGKELLIFPNPQEVLICELFTGTLLSRLRTPTALSTSTAADRDANLSNDSTHKQRTTSLAWRAQETEFYSSHTDKTIRVFKPREAWHEDDDECEDDETDQWSSVDQSGVEKKRKRLELQDMVESLTKRKVTFT